MFNNKITDISETNVSEDNTLDNYCLNIDDDYGYIQTYFYIFLFICLIAGIIIINIK